MKIGIKKILAALLVIALTLPSLGTVFADPKDASFDTAQDGTVATGGPQPEPGRSILNGIGSPPESYNTWGIDISLYEMPNSYDLDCETEEERDNLADTVTTDFKSMADSHYLAHSDSLHFVSKSSTLYGAWSNVQFSNGQSYEPGTNVIQTSGGGVANHWA
jgi:hypothetical protein